jgi:multidrug transporter EmrE-like cation transporter
MIYWRTILFGLGFGLLDSIALPIVKRVSNGADFRWMLLPMVMYAASPFIFLEALKQETLTIMNLVWDLTSDLLITIIGLFFFAEKISPVRLLGVALSFLSLSLMAYEGDGWNDYLQSNYQKVKSIFVR